MRAIAVILLWCCICSICSKDIADDISEAISINPWQYCQGCKHLVQLYISTTANELLAMKKKSVPSKSALEGNKVAEKICEHSSYYNLKPFMRYSCIKVLNEHGSDFLTEFSGQFTANDLRNKADSFRRVRRICGKHTKACDQREFQRANITASQRTRCNACRLIAEEFEMMDNMLPSNISLKLSLGGEFCQLMGYRFFPYQWLEDVCEEMIEENINDIIDILRFRKDVLATGMKPDKSIADMMCEELYKCRVPKQENFQNIEL